MRERRQAVPPEQRQPAAEAALRHLEATGEWRAATVIASYRAFAGEFDPDPIDTGARQAGKVVVYPRIVGPGVMRFHEWRPGEALETRDRHPDQPTEDAVSVELADIGLILVPLLACDNSGFRLGYGGGFYDRALPGIGGFSCGLGFGWQRVAQLPREAHDQPLGGFVSESGFCYLPVGP